MEIIILPRFKVNEICKSINCKFINISITNPNKDDLEIVHNENRLDTLFLKFADFDEEWDTARKEDVITNDQAKEIINFVKKYKDKVDMIVVNCEAGLSRSPAVGGAIAKWLNNDDSLFFKKFNLNRMVYRTLLNNLSIC